MIESNQKWQNFSSEVFKDSGIDVEYKKNSSLLVGNNEDDLRQMEFKLKKLMNEGNTVRVYLPYGDNWYDYSVRRLKENPKMAGYIVKNLFLSIFRIK